VRPAISVQGPLDSPSAAVDVPDYPSALNVAVKGLRIAVPWK